MGQAEVLEEIEKEQRIFLRGMEKDDPSDNILTNVDSLSTISEAIFNKKLWELATIYRNVNFKDNQQKIDFTIGFVSLKFFEEKEEIENNKDIGEVYWKECYDKNPTKLVANLSEYIKRLGRESDFTEFKDLMEIVRESISGGGDRSPIIDKEDVSLIYETIDSMGSLHGTGFDLFGAVYEMFASSKEKKDFGEYFTRRHYTHIFSKLLLKSEGQFNPDKKLKILDLACGTGGFLTESFKVLKNNYEKSRTMDKKAISFLSKDCFWGVDVREENIQRTKLNMFLVGDGHTNMFSENSLRWDFNNEKFDYIITNPPYGNGTIRANTDSISSNRMEIAFLCKIVELLKIGGEACVIIPDGVLENPSIGKFREWILGKCDVNAIISLPKFAFAPYTKEKTYALFIKKRSDSITRFQKNKIWLYIIDNDGLANSDKRFPTKLRNNRNGWMHDEISGWVNTEGEEIEGLLEERWLSYEDNEGTAWIDEKGEEKNMRKAKFISMNDLNEENNFNLLPEYWLRPYEPNYITKKELDIEINKIKNKIQGLI